MTVPEIREKIVKSLKEEYDGSIASSDKEFCKIVGEDNYSKIQHALVTLKEDGIISWYRGGDGRVNNVTLIR